jgi:hypothetical protein
MSDTREDPADDPVGTLLMSARREVDTSALRQPSTMLAGAVAAAPVQARSRRRRRRVIAASVAAFVVVVPTAAAAYTWTTHTGIFGQPDRYTEDVDASEVLDLCAPDFPATARSLMPEELRLPDGASREGAFDTVLSWVTRDCRDGDGVGARMQAVGVPSRAEAYAWCSWVNVYLSDPPERAEAAAALEHYAGSEMSRLVDADGAMTRWMNDIADAAARGDVDRVRYEQRVNCGRGSYGWQP